MRGYFEEDYLLKPHAPKLSKPLTISGIGQYMFEIWQAADEAQFKGFVQSVEEGLKCMLGDKFDQALQAFHDKVDNFQSTL